MWDVKAGKQLAQTPSKQATWAEEIRAKKIAKAQYESPLVAGYRLLPQFTPGKAFFWGTVLSIWGTAMTTTLLAKSNGITMVSAHRAVLPSCLPAPLHVQLLVRGALAKGARMPAAQLGLAWRRHVL